MLFNVAIIIKILSEQKILFITLCTQLAKERNLICLKSLKTSYVRAVFVSEKKEAENDC